MLKIGIQYFAHHKGGGSTKNGRDSEAKRLGVKRADLLTHPKPLRFTKSIKKK